MIPKVSSESVMREVNPKTRPKFSSGEKIRIVLEGLRGEANIAEVFSKGKYFYLRLFPLEDQWSQV